MLFKGFGYSYNVFLQSFFSAFQYFSGLFEVCQCIYNDSAMLSPSFPVRLNAFQSSCMLVQCVCMSFQCFTMACYAFQIFSMLLLYFGNTFLVLPILLQCFAFAMPFQRFPMLFKDFPFNAFAMFSQCFVLLYIAFAMHFKAC